MSKNNSLSINYHESGSGNPIFFIHGLGADHRMFQPQIKQFSKYYHVICPDLRGNGLSPKLKGPVDSILDKQCADVIKLMDELRIDKAIFSGVSYGGVFCFHFAISYGHRVAGLVISDSFSDTKILSVQDFLVMFSSYVSLPLLYFPKLLLPLVKVTI